MKNALLIIISFIAVSCNSASVDIDKGFIKELAKGDFKIPSIKGFFLLFISVNESEKGCTNVNVLHEVFLKHYSETYQSFEAFLSDALNHKIEFSEKDLGKGTPFFKLNDIITKEYNQSDISEFIKIYFDELDDERFAVKKKYNNDEYLYSILYYCFINSYHITLDDYEGNYFITMAS